MSFNLNIEKYKQIFPNYPPVGMLQEGCIYEFASLSKNASACKILVPSEYGLGCIGNIWGAFTNTTNCHWYEENSVRCFEGEELVPRVTICDAASENLPDECWHRIAFKKKDTEFCSEITNPTLQSVCVVRINTWNQYPEVRSTIYFSMP